MNRMTAGTSDSALMLTMCTLQMFVLLLYLISIRFVVVTVNVSLQLVVCTAVHGHIILTDSRSNSYLIPTRTYYQLVPKPKMVFSIPFHVTYILDYTNNNPRDSHHS